MTVLEPETHGNSHAGVLAMIGALRDVLAGRMSRSQVAAWARTRWPENAGQGTPFPRHGSASTVFDSIYNLDRDDVVRDSDLHMYVRWRSQGETFRGDIAPSVSLERELAELVPAPALAEPVRFWLDGLGWYEAVQFGSPATGRAFSAFVALAPPEGAAGVHIIKLASDTLRDAVYDLFETLAIDERDVLYLDPKFDVTTLPEWELWRLDDNGNEALMQTFRSRAKALNTQAIYEARGHRQSYWVRKRA